MSGHIQTTCICPCGNGADAVVSKLLEYNVVCQHHSIILHPQKYIKKSTARRSCIWILKELITPATCRPRPYL